MRCPRCAGEIPEPSRFCGICGHRIDVPEATPATLTDPGSAPSSIPDANYLAGRTPASRAGAAIVPQSSMSLFELPVSRGARLARIAVVLVLDALLLGAGITMIMSYLDARERPRGHSATRPDPVGAVDVEILPPRPVPAATPGSTPAVASTVSVTRRSVVVRKPARAVAATPVRSPDGPPSPSEHRAGDDPGIELPDEADGEVTAPAPSADPDPSADSTPVPSPDRDADPAAGPGPTGDQPPLGSAVADGGIAGDTPLDSDVEILTRKVVVAVNQHKPELERCYRLAAKVATPSEPLQGKVVLRFQIMSDGSAVNVRAVDNTTGSERLATCLTAQVEGWPFPVHSAAAPLEFMWPFVFKASK